MRYVSIFIVALFFSLSLSAQAKISPTDSLIALSQTGSMPLTFSPFQYGLNAITVANYLEPKETTVRNGLPNLFAKILLNTDTIKIGFIGGSITRANDQYRGQALDYLQRTFPKNKFKGINAGVSGTGTELGAFRIQEQLLDYEPDLVFVEFAVNGGSDQAMEGLVRQIIAQNPKTDICFIYTIVGSQTISYQNGDVPSKIKSFEAIAQYYNIPSIHLGMYPAKLEKEGTIVWKGASGSVPMAFSADGTHPNREGGDLYAGAIARGISKIQTTVGVFRSALPSKKFVSDWELGCMYNASTLFNNRFSEISCSGNADYQQFKEWFERVPVLRELQTTSFEFVGSGFGLFDIGGPEAGAIEFEIDGKPASLIKRSDVQFEYSATGTVKQVNRFNQYCNNRYRGQFFWIDMPNGTHRITLKAVKSTESKATLLGAANLADMQKRPEVYAKNELMIGRILVRGTALKVISSVSQIKMENGLFYPNPATNLIKINNADGKMVQILNLSGIKLLETNQSLVDVSKLADGNYFVVQSNTNIVQQLIKN
jgi:lysophospholipase L1-like esterase